MEKPKKTCFQMLCFQKKSSTLLILAVFSNWQLQELPLVFSGSLVSEVYRVAEQPEPKPSTLRVQTWKSSSYVLGLRQYQGAY